MENGDDEKSDLTPKYMLSQWFQSELPCHHQCASLRRHCRARNTENESTLFHQNLTESVSQKRMDIVNEKDIVFQQDIDKIHSFFLHPLGDSMDDIGGRRQRGSRSHIEPLSMSKNQNDALLSSDTIREDEK